MIKLVELYTIELTKDEPTLTIDDVPVRLREQVSASVEARISAEADE